MQTETPRGKGMSMVAIPKLADLLNDPGKVSHVPAEAVPAMLGELERLKATLWARLTLSPHKGQAGTTDNGGRLLDAKEAAAVLHTSTDYLYRHSSRLPFTVRMGRKVLFSETGIERYIRARMGR
jgi:predicted DNA-binding transcriptional regulator AlpA